MEGPGQGLPDTDKHNPAGSGAGVSLALPHKNGRRLPSTKLLGGSIFRPASVALNTRTPNVGGVSASTVTLGSSCCGKLVGVHLRLATRQGQQNHGDCCQDKASHHKLLGFFHFRILLYEFYFHPAHCRDELRKTDLNEKRPAAHSLPKECATGLPAPDILASFERVSSIIYLLSAVCCLLSAVCCLLSAVCEGLYRDKFICQRIFFCGKHTFFAPEYIFSPTDNFVAARRCHQPGKTTKSNFK